MAEIPAFDVWETTVDETEYADPLWRMAAYRFARYAMDSGWPDVRVLSRTHATRGVASQLYEALGSIAAHIAEGYSRSSGPDRVRFFEYALGSARECIAWYRAACPVLGADVCNKRIATLVRIRRLLLTAIPSERTRSLRRTNPR